MSEGLGLPGGEEPRERRVPRDETPDGTRGGTDEATESAERA